MEQQERLNLMISSLLSEMPQYKEQSKEFSTNEQFRLFRSLVNLRPAMSASSEFLKIQDDFLKAEIDAKGITELNDLIPIDKDMYLWQGDITTLHCDAIVNAANSKMLGCFCPCHGCIDNAIHTYSGIQLRLACAELMRKQGCDEATGKAKITPAFNLPSQYVLHTVGPIVEEIPSENDCEELASCYYSCLALAEEYRLSSVAFCCISTGEFHFPNKKAAEIAIETVNKYKAYNHSEIKVIFNVFKEIDYNIYRDLFREYTKIKI